MLPPVRSDEPLSVFVMVKTVDTQGLQRRRLTLLTACTSVEPPVEATHPNVSM